MLSVARRRALGVAVIVGTLVLVLLAVIRPEPFKDSRTIVAEFDRVQGLGRIDRNVRIGGANVGVVGDVVRIDDSVQIELKIEPGISVRNDARANLRPHTLFEGSAFVDLHPGSPSAPELGADEIIPSGQTSTYTSLDEATRLLNESNRKKLKRLVESQRKILRDEGVRGLRRILAAAPGLFRNTAPTVHALRGPGGDELIGAISGLAKTADALASEEEDLLPFVQHANRTVAALRVDDGAPLDDVLVALPDALESFAAARIPLRDLLSRIKTLSVELQPMARELVPLLRSAQPLLRRTTPIIRDATPLIAGLRVVLARVSRAAPALEKAIEALAPGSRVLVNRVLPAFNATSRNGLPVYAQLAMAFSSTSSTGRSFQTPQQSPNNGHIVRVAAHVNAGQGLGGLLLPPCSSIAAINQTLADQLELEGLCNP